MATIFPTSVHQRRLGGHRAPLEADYPAKLGDNTALALGGTDQERLTRIFNALAQGGKTQMPLPKQPWGAEVGWLVDRFGVPWTVNID